MNSKYIFPVILIVLQLGAGVVCALHKDVRMTIYWGAAAVLNIAVVMG